MHHLVSVIVPNYNHAAYLEKRLASVFSQTYQNFEVLLLDDASTDNSIAILSQYKNHPKVSQFIVNEKNSGSPFLQWQKGLTLAKGDFIWIAESDDYCDFDFLEKQLESIGDHIAVVAKTITFDSGALKKTIEHPAFYDTNPAKLDVSSLLYCPILNVSTTVFRNVNKDRISLAQFITYPIIGDRVFYYEFFQQKSVVKNDQTTSYFRQQGEGISNLETKGPTYLTAYFKEHMRFITFVKDTSQEPLGDLPIKYVKRFFYRVRDRLSKKEKLSIKYLSLYLYYKYKLYQLR